MKLSPLGYAEVASHEGICLRPYFDSVGVLTVGIGHTAAAGAPDPRSLPRGKDQAMSDVLAWYMRDMEDVERDVNRLVKVPLKQYQFDALCSFHFNTGGLARAALLQSLNRGDYDAAADGFMGWVKPPEIRGRRVREQTLFRMGTYSSGGMVPVFPVSPNGTPLYGRGKEVDVAALIAAMGRPEVLPEPVIPPPRRVPRKPEPEPEPPPTPFPSPAQQGGIAAAIAALIGGFLFAGQQIADWFKHLFGG
jgi:lysozyme